MSLFRNKENIKPASQLVRNKVNLYNVFVFLLVLLFTINLDFAPSYLKIGIIIVYIAFLIPLFLSLGGTVGHVLSNVRVRKFDDNEKNISLSEAYKRLFILLLNNWIGIFSSSKDNKLMFEEKSNTQTVELDIDTDSEDVMLYEKKVSFRKFIIYSVIYLAWVVWLGNFWFVLGVGVIYDMYVSRRVNWSPWKSRTKENPMLIEWLDALIFAVIAVTIINIFLFQNYKIPTGSMEKSLQINDHLYVSKLAYGPRIPLTPLSLPFVQHTIPGTTKNSYSELIKWDYKRLKGLREIKRWEPVVFNFPEGDTVCLQRNNVSYYYIIREMADVLKRNDVNANKELKTKDEYWSEARKIVWDEYDIVVRPIDKRDNYIKRCVGIPGDTLEIIDGVIYINGEKEPYIEGRQRHYYFNTDGKRINSRLTEELDLYPEDISYQGEYAIVNTTKSGADKLGDIKTFGQVNPIIIPKGSAELNVFPYSELYPWNIDQFGPMYIPEKGATTQLNMDNICFYKRIIGYYEGNDLEIKDSTIYINGEVSTEYTFKMNYYWMMGDNRNNSLDSRIWGYVPEDHIIGSPRFIWLSMHKEKKFPANIRLKRIFKTIH